MSGNLERRDVEDDVLPVEIQKSLGQDQNQGQMTTTEGGGARSYYRTELRLEKRWRVGVYEKELELKVAREQYEDIKARYEKSKQKQRNLRTKETNLLIEIAALKEEKRMRDLFKDEIKQQRECENQSQSVEQEVLMSQLTDLKKSKEEEKAKVKDLKQKQRELELLKDQLQEKIRQCDVDKQQNEAIKAELLDVQRQLQSLNQGVQNAAEKEKVVEKRQKEIWKLYENVDQVMSMYEQKIEELREEMTRLTSRENLKEVLRQTNEDQSVMTSDIPVLLQKIRPFFVFCVNPLNVLVIIHSHGPRVLVEQDFQEIQCVTEQRGNIMGASKLLTRLVQYPGWLPCIIKVLRDDRVRRSHVADMIEEVVEAVESDEQGAFSSEVKTFLEEKEKQTSQVEMLQKSIEDLKDEMQEKTEQHQRELVNKDQEHNKRVEENNEQHKNQIQCLTRDHEKELQKLSQKQKAEVKTLTEEIKQKNEEKEKADKDIEKLKDEIKTNEEKHREDMKSKEEQHRCKSEELEKKIQSYETRIEKLRQEKTELEKMQARTLPVTGFKAQSTCRLTTGYTTTIKNYQTVETNHGGHFDPVTGIYTINTDGKYHVTFSTDRQKGYLYLQHVKVSDKSDTTICDNHSSPFDKGVKQATHDGVMYRGDTLYLAGGSYLVSYIDNVTVRFSVSFLG